MKRIWIFFAVGLLVGTVLTNVLQVGLVQGVWNYQLSLATVRPLDLFFYIWKQRLVSMLVLWLLSFTVFCYPVIYGYAAYYGFSVSVIISALTIEQGIKSIFLYGAMCFPQMLIYLPVWILFIQKCMIEYEKSRPAEIAKKTSEKSQTLHWCLAFLLFLAVYTVGIMLEAFVNPWVITKCLSFL